MNFLDTNILVGAADESDDLHSEGRAVLAHVASGREGETLVNDFVLDEMMTILGRRRKIGPEGAARFSQQVLSSPRVQCVYIDAPMFVEASTIFGRHGKSLSFTDATIVATMRNRGCTLLYSNDDGFDRIPGISRLQSP